MDHATPATANGAQSHATPPRFDDDTLVAHVGAARRRLAAVLAIARGGELASEAVAARLLEELGRLGSALEDVEGDLGEEDDGPEASLAFIRVLAEALGAQLDVGDLALAALEARGDVCKAASDLGGVLVAVRGARARILVEVGL